MLLIEWQKLPRNGNCEAMSLDQIDSSSFPAVFGGLELHGKPHSVTWTRLASTATTETKQLSLIESVDWSVGDEIVITPTGFTPFEVEVKKIAAISEDGMTLTLNETLQHSHTGK